MKNELFFVEEPNLVFGFDQKTIDPRDGLVLFGPHKPLTPYTLRIGVIGFAENILDYSVFVRQLNQPIISTKRDYSNIKSMERSRPSFPGFEAIFNVRWPENPEVSMPLDKFEIQRSLSNKNKSQRTNQLVDQFLDKIVDFHKKEDNRLDLWFLIIPFQIYAACKPGSWGRSMSKGTKQYVDLKKAGQASIGFEEYADYDEVISRIMDTATDFHHLIKARLIQENIKIPVQLVIDRTLAFKNKETNIPYDQYLKANLAWTQSTTLYYKLGKLPWKLGDIREGVCYIGLVFKKLPNDRHRNVCSAAQMFLHDGDGSVFRGNIGLWESEKPNEYHLDSPSAEELIGMALDDYQQKWGKYPTELFIHSRTIFNDTEWNGFEKAVSKRKATTNLVGILIKDLNELKLYRHAPNQISNYGVMRGTALIIDEREAYLCTKGFIPRLNSSNSMEMPRNLKIKIIRGNADIKIVLKDIMGLTKLNYNSCVYGDGIPVTLKFSNKIANILTAIPEWKVDTKQFMYYI
ncbi:MAG: hypothetical protein ACTHMM_04885 [Agriterribacter sp.]